MTTPEDDRESCFRLATAFVKALKEGNLPDPEAVIPYKSLETDVASLSDAYRAVKGRVQTIVLSHKTWADLRFFCRDLLDIESQAEWNKRGGHGLLWGAYIFSFENDYPAWGDFYVVGQASSYTKLARQA
jgi:hypothetical protein